MKIGPINFPGALIEAIRTDTLVVFAGAGVSMGAPSNLPSFRSLAELISQGSGRVPTEPLDRFLGQLQHTGVRVHERAASHLDKPGLQHTSLHENLLRVFGSPDSVRLVTTNFDRLFQSAAHAIWNSVPETFRAPALPRGRRFAGLVHVHGSVSLPESAVLTDSDFGRAYLTEGWAREFLVDVFRHYTVLFVGYRHEDTVLRYLARALPAEDSRGRYALDAESAEAASRWDLLGIQLIAFPKASNGDYSSLYLGIERLAARARRGMLDSKRAISSIAAGLPPVEQEAIDEILHALQNPATTAFFVENASHVEWLSWLDGRGCIEALFQPGKLEECHSKLARWIARHFAANHPHQVIQLIGRHELNLSPTFWWELASEIARSDGPISDDVLAKWITVLLETEPARTADGFILQWLAERAAKQDLTSSVLQIFLRLAEDRVNLKPGWSWPTENAEPSPPSTDLELAIAADVGNLQEIWTSGLAPRLDVVATAALAAIVSRLERRHAIQANWGKANRNWDTDSYSRSAIEPHSQDRYPSPLDVVIDAARDSLSHLIRKQHRAASGWIERLASAESPLLRRLAVYGLLGDSRSSDQKLDFVLSLLDLHDIPLHHEIFALLRQTYASATEPIQAKVVSAIQSYKWPDATDAEAAAYADGVKLDWLCWLHDSDSSCPLVSAALNEIRARNPSLEPREHPDFTHWTGEVGWGAEESPWSVEHLLAQPVDVQLEELLTFRGSDFRGPNRSGLLQSVEAAATQSAVWGLALAQALKSKSEWESDLWPVLLRAWSALPIEAAEMTTVLGLMENQELQSAQPRALTDALYAFVRDGGKPHVGQVLPITNRIAAALWPPPSDGDKGPSKRGEWLQHAINRPTGILAEYWITSLSLYAKEQSTRELPTEYRAALERLLSELSIAGDNARTVIASQFTFIHSLDREWAVQYLLPLFTSANSAHFAQAWDGFLTWGRLTPATVGTLAPAFLAAIPRVAAELPSNQARFVEFYVAALALYVDDPLKEWIPHFFVTAGPAEKRSFAAHLGEMLRRLSDEQQREWWKSWLSVYWTNRISGVPAPLDAGEVEYMLGWLVYLPAVFSEAVGIAERMPPGRLERSHILYRLKNHAVLKKHPNDVGRLLIVILRCTGPDHALCGLSEIVEELSHETLDANVQQRLIELLLARGLSPGPLART